VEVRRNTPDPSDRPQERRSALPRDRSRRRPCTFGSDDKENTDAGIAFLGILGVVGAAAGASWFMSRP
jgi:hypothetical protein